MAQTHATTALTYSAVAITSLVDVTSDEASLSETPLHTDAATHQQAHFVDGVHHTITVTTTDLDFRDNWELGNDAALVWTKALRTNGSGSGATQTNTYASAVLVGKNEGAPHAGQATLVLTFRAVNSAGTTPVAYA